jgi:hypothetical protein
VEFEQHVGARDRVREVRQVDYYSSKVWGVGEDLLYSLEIGGSNPYVRFEGFC